MEQKRITKAMRNADIIAILQGEKPQYGTTVAEAVAHLNHENELLANKASATRKPTKEQIANEGYKDMIMKVLSAETGKTATDVQKAIPAFAEFNNQKVAALLRSLRDEGKVVKDTIKGRSYFFLAQ